MFLLITILSNILLNENYNFYFFKKEANLAFTKE